MERRRKVGRNSPKEYFEQERAAQADYMSRKRAAARDLEIPPVADPKRRERGRADPEFYLRAYFPHVFYNPFVADQREIIGDGIACIRYGGRQAVAAERGGGKTSIIKGLMTWGLNYGILKYPVAVAASGPYAKRILADIKSEYETNQLLLADFPEICVPIQALEGANQRAGVQTVNGQRTMLKWSGELIQFPTVEGSPASGSMVSTTGIDGAIRGLVYRGQRPDFVFLDDIDTRESAESVIQTSQRSRIIDQDIGGLAGPGERMAMLMACTILNRRCIAFRYTDRDQMPAWNGKRQRLLVTMPKNAESWAEYIQMRQEDQAKGDKHGRRAHAYYAAHRAEMDEGAEVSNPYRFIGEPLADGTEQELSTLEHCYNLIADNGRGNFDTELQNDPPAESDPETNNIQAYDIQKRLNGLDRGVIPSWSQVVTAYIDVHGRSLNWVVLASDSGLRGAVIDYGVDVVNSPQQGRLNDPENRDAVDHAILSALLTWRDRERDYGWPAETGEVKHANLVLVDSGWRPDPVYAFVKSTAGGYMPSKGHGTGRGMRKYGEPRQGEAKTVGPHWNISRLPEFGVNLANIDVDHWKRTTHDGFLAPESRPGSLTLFGTNPHTHGAYAVQVIAEVWTRVFIQGEGKGWKEFWDARGKDNHYFDATAGAIAAASMLGARTVEAVPPQPPQAAHPHGTPAHGPDRQKQRFLNRRSNSPWLRNRR